MSDANKQSIERCKYRHNWQARCEKSEIVAYVCETCGHEPKRDSKLWHEAEAIIHLSSLLAPNDTVYTVLRHVSRSGMSRNIDLYMMRDGQPEWITAYVGHALGTPQSRKNWEKSQGLTVGGCGMDMGFSLVYNLGRVLFPKGFAVTGRGRNGDTSGHDNDGGYALNHKWL